MLVQMSTLPSTATVDALLAVIEHFGVLMYNKTSVLSDVNKVKQHLFSAWSRSIESVPPTQAALKQIFCLL